MTYCTAHLTTNSGENIMNKRIWPLMVAILTIFVALLLLPGCSDVNNTAPTKAERQLQARPVDLLLTDCSGSFKSKLDQFTDTFEEVVSDSASRGRRLLHACFDGSALRSLVWMPKADFSQIPDAVKTNPQVASRFTEARALGTVKRIERAIATTENQVGGSGQLEALEVAARTPEVGRVVMVTDLLSFEVDGIDLADATEADIAKTVKLWLPRLGSGLEAVQVFIVGYGLDAGSSKAVRNAVALFTRLITKAGGRVSITKDLPDSLGIGG